MVKSRKFLECCQWCRLLCLIWNERKKLIESLAKTRSTNPWSMEKIKLPIKFHYRNLLASRSDSIKVRMSPSRTGPLTLRMMERLDSSRNSTRTCVAWPWDPVRPSTFVTYEKREKYHVIPQKNPGDPPRTRYEWAVFHRSHERKVIQWTFYLSKTNFIHFGWVRFV